MPDFLDYRFSSNEDYVTGVLNQYTLHEKNAKIPHIVAGFEINSVGRWAFSYATDSYYVENLLESIELEEGYLDLYHGAFYGCDKLKKVILPSTLKKMYGNPFEGADNLETIEFPNGNDYFVFEDGILYNKDKTVKYFERKKV